MIIPSFLAVLLILLPPNIAAKSEEDFYVQPNLRQKEVLSGAVEALLDYKHSDGGYYSSAAPKSQNAAAAYMKQLFQKYKSEGGPRDNLVQSIDPAPGTDGSSLCFNLDSLKATDTIHRAEIHFIQRHHRNRKHTQHVTSQVLTRTGLWEQASMSRVTDKWVAFDVSKWITEGEKLRVRFQSLRRSGRYKDRKADKVLRRNAPFLLVYSNEQDIAHQEDVAAAFFAPEERLHRSKRSNYYSYSNSDAEKPTANPFRAFHEEGPDLLRTRKELRKQKKLHRKAEKRWRHRSGDLPLPPEKMDVRDWEQPEPSNDIKAYLTEKEEPNVVLLGANGGKTVLTPGPCSKRHLNVDFKDLGWGDKIIAPESFEAHYCAGSCSFPMQPEMNPSNHGTIQSLVHAIGLNPYVPPVCCAPEKLDSLTLLFFNEKGNVVLKNYPRMIVTSCACL